MPPYPKVSPTHISTAKKKNSDPIENKIFTVELPNCVTISLGFILGRNWPTVFVILVGGRKLCLLSQSRVANIPQVLFLDPRHDISQQAWYRPEINKKVIDILPTQRSEKQMLLNIHRVHAHRYSCLLLPASESHLKYKDMPINHKTTK